MTDGYITYTTGTGGTWIAWLTEVDPPANATGRDLVSCPGLVRFAIGATPEVALSNLRAQQAALPPSGSLV
jgi:hypothetical protein